MDNKQQAGKHPDLLKHRKRRLENQLPGLFYCTRKTSQINRNMSQYKRFYPENSRNNE